MALRLTTVSKCLAVANTVPKFIFEGLLPFGTMGLLAAPPGWGKTTFAIQLAASVATGQPCLGITPTGGMSQVLFVELESSPEIFCQRVEAWSSRIPEDTRDGVRDLIDANLHICSPDYDDEFTPGDVMGIDLPTLVEAKGFAPGVLKLIIVDTLSAVSVGDENAVEPARHIWGQVNQLAAMTGATVLMLHHTTKTKFTPGGRPTDPMSPEAVRGSSAHLAAARFVIQGCQSTNRKAPWKADDTPDVFMAKLGLTKFNDGPMPQHIDVKRSADTQGFWEPVTGQEEAETSQKGSAAPTKMNELLQAACTLQKSTGRVDREALEEAAAGIGMDFRSGLRNLRDKGLLHHDDCQPTEQGLALCASLSGKKSSWRPEGY
jgi:hypothetical protein